MKNLFLFTLSLLISTSCFAITITWNAGTGKWTRASNWSPAQVPGPNDDVIIPSGNVHLLNGTQTVKSVDIRLGAYLKIAAGKTLIITQSQQSFALLNSGTIEIFGNLEISDPLISGSWGIQNFNMATIFSSGNLYIHDISQEGIRNSPNAVFTNSGQCNIENIAYSGLANEGSFYNNGDILLQNCGTSGYSSALSNVDYFLNQGNISIIDASNISLNNTAQFDNISSGTIHIINYDNFAVYNSDGGVLENDGGQIICEGVLNSPSTSIFNRGDFINTNCGEVFVDNEIKINAGLVHNEAWLYSTYTWNHINIATFINDGVIHDPEDAFALMPMQNNGIIVRPLQGTVYTGQPVSNALGLGSLTGFVIGYWLDPNYSFKTGSYNAMLNRFTPYSSALGLDSIKVQIYFGSCGNRYFTIPIPGGIQAPPSPFAIPDGNQNQSTQDIQLYPNPARDLVTIKLPDNQGVIAAIQILDATGKQVASLAPKDQINTLSFSVQDFPAGLYWISIVFDKGNRSIKKLIVE